MKHIDSKVKHSIDLHCTDRGQHDSVRIGVLEEMHDGRIWGGTVGRRHETRARRRHDQGVTVPAERVQNRTANLGKIHEQIRERWGPQKRQGIPDFRYDRPVSLAEVAERVDIDNITIEMLCPVCGRNPQISGPLLRDLWPQLLAANIGRVDISSLPF